MKGKDIKRNGYDWPHSYVVNTHNGYKTDNGEIISRIDIQDYPSLKKWFDSGDWNNKPEKGTNQQRLRGRADQGDTPYNLRDCAYMDDFDKQKICYSETNDAINTKVCLDADGYVTDKTCFIIVANDMSLLKHLYKTMSSSIFTWYMLRKSPRLGERGISLTKDTVELFPLANISENNAEQDYFLTDEEIKFISSSVR